MSEITEKLASLEDVLAGARPWENRDLEAKEGIIIRRHFVDLLRMDGKCPFEISRLLGVPDTTVRRDIESIEKDEARGDLAEVRDQRRGEIYKRYLRVIDKAEDHRREAMKLAVKKTAKKEGDKETKAAEESGPRIAEANAALKIQRETLEGIAKLYGLDVQAHELSGQGGGDIPISAKVAGLFGEIELPAEVATRLDAFLESIITGGQEGAV
ncbi:MAG: hypothetical protein PVH29_14540 [Candidatus Zixiibacteriota bacterium]|jgi:hypothetical protein